MSSIIRVMFERQEEVKFISHLDLMRAFDRTIRRAELPISYSQGFNPHPLMVFALPLAVGVTSQCEFAQFELDENIEPFSFMEIMNANLPKGILIKEAVLRETRGNLMSEINAADYELLVRSKKYLKESKLHDSLDSLLKMDTIRIQKQTKNGTKEVDIKPMIHLLSYKRLTDNVVQPMEEHIVINNWINANLKLEVSMENVFFLSARVDAGSSSNLKPELIIEALNRYFGFESKAIRIHRKALYSGTSENLKNPLYADA